MGRMKFCTSSGICACPGSVSRLFILFSFSVSVLVPAFTSVAHCASLTELGSAGDLIVLGAGGIASDPNVKIKGFTVFGATQSAYTGVLAGDGNVVINGALAVSSGAYFLGGSTFTTGGAYFTGISSFNSVGNMYVTGGAASQVLASQGPNQPLTWTAVSALGDNLGDHTATKALNLAGNQVMNVSTLTVAGNAFSVGGSTFAVKSGFVGIGTAAPAYALDVRSAGIAGTPDMVNIANPNAGGLSDIVFGDNLGAGKGAIGYGNASAPLLPGTMMFVSGVGVDISLGTDNNFAGSVLERLRVKADSGNVGISTGNPQARLDVVAGGSTAADMVQIWRDSGGVIVGSMSATGVFEAVKILGDISGASGLPSGDNLGNHTATKNLTMTGYNIVGAQYVTASSAALSGQLIVYGTSTLTGNTGIGGTLGVTGAATLSNNLTVAGISALNGNITLGNATADLITMNGQATFIGGSTFTTGGAYFQGISSFSNVDNIYVAGGTGGQVLKKVAGGAMVWDDDGAPASIDVSTINATSTTPYGGVNITTNVFISGGATIAKYTVQAANTGITLTSADFGKTITVNSASAQIVYLPAVTAADIGATITVVKLGAGKVTIDAVASTYIADSTASGTIYNNAVSPAYATITLRLVTATQWMLVGGEGSWITT